LAKVKQIYAKNRDDKSPEDIRSVIEFFKQEGGIKFAEELVDKLAKEAMNNFENLEKDLPEDEVKKVARSAITKMVSREK